MKQLIQNKSQSKYILETRFDSTVGASKAHVHGLCRYPARMYPHVVTTLIEQLTQEDSLVYDPYCGSGTVLVESALQGCNVVGADTNPLACLISKVKTTLISNSKLIYLQNKIERDISQIKDDIFLNELPFDSIEVNLQYWFKPQTIKRLSVLYHLLFTEWLDFDNSTHNFLKLCFARLVREVSNVRKNEFKLYRKSPDNLKEYTPQILNRFIEIVNENCIRLNEFQSYLTVKTKSKIYNKSNDIITLKQKADVVFTSPPYGDNPTTITYGQFSRYSLLWLGFPKKVVYSIDKFLPINTKDYSKMLDILFYCKSYQKIINKINRRDENRATDVEKYFVMLAKSFIKINSNVRRHGKICMIIGPRTVRNVSIPNPDIITELDQELNLKHIQTIERNIAFKTLPRRNSTGKTIQNEKIIIFEKR